MRRLARAMALIVVLTTGCGGGQARLSPAAPGQTTTESSLDTSTTVDSSTSEVAQTTATGTDDPLRPSSVDGPVIRSLIPPTPGADTLLSLLTGTLVLRDGCLLVQQTTGHYILVVFPYGTTWDAANQTVSLGNVSVGDVVNWGGLWFDAPRGSLIEELDAEGLAAVDRCLALGDVSVASS